MSGIFAFTTEVSDTHLYFYDVSDDATVYHHQTHTTYDLGEGACYFYEAGDYTIRGAFGTVHAIDREYKYTASYTPFRAGVVSRWEDTRTVNMSTLFASSQLDYIAPPPTTVQDMSGVFMSAKRIPDIQQWDTNNVRNMSSIFQNSNMQQNINMWDVSNVEYMVAMFANTAYFNHPLDAWDVSRVKDMRLMFYAAQQFNQDLSSWNTGNVQDMSQTFQKAAVFNNGGAPLQWDTSSVRDMSRMFSGATAFQQDISAWDVSNVEDISYMMYFAEAFVNSEIILDYWDTSKVENSLNFTRTTDDKRIDLEALVMHL